MSDFVTRSYTKTLKAHDSDLYAERMSNGVIHVYRKHPFSLSPTQFVLALTDNWQANGRPREWGHLPLIMRLKAIDLMNNPALFEELLSSYKKREEAGEKDARNSFEAMAYEMYPAFKKTFYDTNTSNLKKQTRRQEMGI